MPRQACDGHCNTAMDQMIAGCMLGRLIVFGDEEPAPPPLDVYEQVYLHVCVNLVTQPAL